jgi:CheY-like chemotaxis protein
LTHFGRSEDIIKTLNAISYSELTHDLLNPLQGVLGTAKLLLDTTLDDGQREYVQTIIKSAESLLAEVRSLTETTAPAQIEPARTANLELFRDKRILLVEDGLVNQMVTTKTLEKFGFKIDVANNGRKAVEILKTTRYDLILMDCEMPEMDGYEATRRIHALPSTLAKTPIIAMTANAVEGDRERCLEVGMNDYISKPIKLPNLLAAIEKVLKT